MALVLTNCSIVVGGTDIGVYAKSVTLDLKGDELDATVFQGGGWRQRVGGLKDGSIKIDFIDDFGVSGLDQYLWSIFNTVATIVVKGDAGTTTSTNAKYSGSALISQFSPIGGNVGDLAAQSLTWPTSGTLTRATS